MCHQHVIINEMFSFFFFHIKSSKSSEYFTPTSQQGPVTFQVLCDMRLVTIVLEGANLEVEVNSVPNWAS